MLGTGAAAQSAPAQQTPAQQTLATHTGPREMQDSAEEEEVGQGLTDVRDKPANQTGSDEIQDSGDEGLTDVDQGGQGGFSAWLGLGSFAPPPSDSEEERPQETSKGKATAHRKAGNSKKRKAIGTPPPDSDAAPEARNVGKKRKVIASPERESEDANVSDKRKTSARKPARREPQSVAAAATRLPPTRAAKTQTMALVKALEPAPVGATTRSQTRCALVADRGADDHESSDHSGDDCMDVEDERPSRIPAPACRPDSNLECTIRRSIAGMGPAPPSVTRESILLALQQLADQYHPGGYFVYQHVVMHATSQQKSFVRRTLTSAYEDRETLTNFIKASGAAKEPVSIALCIVNDQRLIAVPRDQLLKVHKSPHHAFLILLIRPRRPMQRMQWLFFDPNVVDPLTNNQGALYGKALHPKQVDWVKREHLQPHQIWRNLPREEVNDKAYCAELALEHAVEICALGLNYSSDGAGNYEIEGYQRFQRM